MQVWYRYFIWVREDAEPMRIIDAKCEWGYINALSGVDSFRNEWEVIGELGGESESGAHIG